MFFGGKCVGSYVVVLAIRRGILLFGVGDWVFAGYLSFGANGWGFAEILRFGAGGGFGEEYCNSERTIEVGENIVI